jgi:rhamnosyltransferase
LDKINVIHSSTNKGIAWALNVGIKEAIKLGFNWVITFDQDSLPNQYLLDYYSRVLESEKNVGIVGTQFSEDVGAFSQISWKESLTIITSGTLHPITLFDSVGFYNEKLFIDCVDFDFSMRVKLAGYKVLRIEQPLLSHKLGTPVKKYGIESSNHNLIRRYYYARNHVFLTRNYFSKFPFWILTKNYFFTKSIFQLLLVEDNVFKKLKTISKGIKDGYKGF